MTNASGTSQKRIRSDAIRSAGFLFIFGGFFLGVITLWVMLDTLLFIATSKCAEGVVMGLEEWTERREGQGEVRLFVAVVRFSIEGRIVEARIGEPPRPVTGAKYLLRYRPDHPEMARRDDGVWAAFYTPAFSGVIALSAFLAGSLFIRLAKASGRHPTSK